MVGRLRPDVSIDQAAAALEAPFRDAVAMSGIPEVEWPQVLGRLVVEPGARGVSGLRDRYGQTAWLLMSLVVLVLLVASANVANLVVARATARREEFAVQVALGASRAQLVGPLVCESAIVSIAGSLAGLAVAAWAGRGLVAALAFDDPGVSLTVGLDARVLIFTGGALVVTIVASGLLPALMSARVDPARGLASSRLGAGSSTRLSWPRQGLVVVQVGLSVTLLAAASLLVHSLVNLSTHEVGFDANRVLAVSVVDGPGVRPGRQFGDVVIDLMDTIGRMPGVESVSQSTVPPMSSATIGINVRVDDAPDPATSHAFFASVSPDYFRTIGTPLRAGREIAAEDVGGGPPVVVVNEALARRLFGRSDPLGRSIRFVEGNRPPMTVIGVAADATYNDVREEAQSVLYLPSRLAGQRLPRTTMLVRSRGERADALAAPVERAIRSTDAGVTVAGARALRTDLSDSLHGDLLVASLASAFGALALVITAIGLFGVLSALVAGQTREIGLRMALGADPRRVARFVIAPAFHLVAAGILLGGAGAWLAGRAISGLLFELLPSDLVSFSASEIRQGSAGVRSCIDTSGRS